MFRGSILFKSICEIMVEQTNVVKVFFFCSRSVERVTFFDWDAGILGRKLRYLLDDDDNM